jgi:hypothetical protein
MRAPVGIVLVLLCGCSGVSVIRDAPPLRLDGGAPLSECERDGYLEIARALVIATATSTTTDAWGHTHGQSREAKGLAIFRIGAAYAENLNELLPRMGDPRLAAIHLQRTSSIESRSTTADVLSYGGGAVAIVAGGAFLGIFAGRSAEGDSSFTPAMSVSLGLAGAGLVAAIVGEIVRPSLSEQTYAGVRRYLLLPGEDDLDSAAAQVERHNLDVREQCGRAAGW